LVVNDLFTPTIRALPTTGKPPWSVSMLVFPAIIGGPLAITVLALINGRRLGIAPGGQLAVAAAGVCAMVLRLWVLAVVLSSTDGRVVSALTGALAYGPVLLVQRRPYRAFTLRGGEADGLLLPGFVAAAGGAVIEAVLAAAVILAITR
jgi:hypothetical protein